VCNIEVLSFIDTVAIDVDYIRFYKDSKDDTIAYFWENFTGITQMLTEWKICLSAVKQG
jgi:hypothetical protein